MNEPKFVPVEVFDSHCNYASFAGRVCNKCGRIHDGGKSVAVVEEPVAWDNFPGYLIDHQEGSIVTEENLQFWLSAFIKNTDYNKPTHSIPAADLATLREKAAEADELRKDAEKRDAREDRHWRAGFMDGWNAGVIGDESALKAAGERLDAAIAQDKGE